MPPEHLGKAAAARLMKEIEPVPADRRFQTPDPGGAARTTDVIAATDRADD